MSPPYWSDAGLYRKSGFGTANGYKEIGKGHTSESHQRIVLFSHT